MHKSLVTLYLVILCVSQVEEEGHYVGCVKYRGQRIGPPSFTIICLNGEQYMGVQVESCFLHKDVLVCLLASRHRCSCGREEYLTEKPECVV